MPIECNACGTKARTVFFRSYSHYPRQVRNLWWLVLFGAAISMFNAARLLFDLFDLQQEVTLLQEYVAGHEELTEEAPIIGDASAFMLRAVNFLMFVSIVVVLYLPTRYGIVLKRFRRGKPTTYWQIRDTAILTIAVTVFTYLMIVYLLSELQTIDVGPRLGLNIAVAPLILLQMRRREVREYFSQFRWEALPPVELVHHTFIPEDAAPKSEWERLD